MPTTASAPRPEARGLASSNAMIVGALLSLLATLIWSGNFIIARGLGQAIQPATLSFLRWTLALACLAPFAARAVWRDRRALARHLPYLALTSLFGVTLLNTFIYIAGRSTEALNLALIATSSPIIMILLARVFLGEAITPRKLAGLAIAVGGVLLIITRGELDRLTGMVFAQGDIWMLMSATCFASYSTLVRAKPKEIGSTSFLAAGFGIGLVLLAPWAGWEVLRYGPPVFTPQITWSVLYVGIGASLLAYMFWNGAVSRIGSAGAGMIYYLIPLFSGLEAWALLDETVGWYHLMGGVGIIGGIVLATRVVKPKLVRETAG
ncbi:DMT family transporter [Desulfocurvus sp. DL9XJH121]